MRGVCQEYRADRMKLAEVRAAGEVTITGRSGAHERREEG